MSYRHAFIAGLFSLLSAHVCAQIVIGQTSGFTGPVAPSVKELTDGARLYIDAINQQGGVNGQRIELVSLDDKFDPKLAAENARKLILERGASALFLVRGTPHTEAVLPLLAEHKIPLIAPSTGAMILHKPVNPYVFNVRPTYQKEAELAVKSLKSIGIERIGIFHVDDTFGLDLLEGAQAGFRAAKLEPLFVHKFDRSKPDFGPIVQAGLLKNPHAILIVGSAAAVTDGTRTLRAAGSHAQVVTFSNNASNGFIKSLGEHGPGVIVAQVFPYERSLSSPLVREATQLAERRELAVSPQMLEGFAAAKVLVEGLRRAGPSPTGPRIQAALDSLRDYDLGGMPLSFSRSDHTGLDFVDLSVIAKDGRFRR